MRYVSAAAIAATIAFVWGAVQVISLVSANRETTRLRESIAEQSAVVAPMRTVAQRRADLVAQAAFIRDGIAERAALTRTLASIAASAGDGISFDTLHVQRAGDGWSTTIQGTARGATTTQAVFGLDALVRSIRGQHGVSSASLDDFDYPKQPGDSLPHAGEPITIAFHLSFTTRRDARDH
jgi:hypothetical protein